VLRRRTTVALRGLASEDVVQRIEDSSSFEGAKRLMPPALLRRRLIERVDVQPGDPVPGVVYGGDGAPANARQNKGPLSRAFVE
jgi:hypothetical protein